MTYESREEKKAALLAGDGIESKRNKRWGDEALW